MPLEELYEIIAGCNDTEGANFCGVLVKVVDENIKNFNGGMDFLLQVWKLGGTLVFEKALEKEPCYWNMTSDKFLF